MEGNHYEEVILDLQRKRDELGAVINLLRRLGNSTPVAAAVIPAAAVIAASGNGKRPRRHPRQAPRGDGSDKVCKKCGTLKLLDEFPKAKNCSDGHLGTCKPCCAAKARKRYAEKHGGAPGTDLPIYPKACLLCHDPFSNYKRWKDHMKKVHGKKV